MIEISTPKNELLQFIESLQGVEYTHIALNQSDSADIECGEEWLEMRAYNGDTLVFAWDVEREFSPH